MRRVIIAFACVATLFFLAFVWRYPWLSVGVLALSHALVLYPTLRPNAQWLGPVYASFAAEKPELWLTIDDGPTADTPALLDLLDSRRVRAAFFVKGSLAQSAPNLVREIIQRGHAVGNHSQTHPSGTCWCLPPTRVRREIERCSAVIREIAGSPPSLFRAPVGMKNPFVHPVLHENGMRLIGWNCRAYDAVKSDSDAIAASIEKQLRPGSIIVVHQGRAWSLRTIAAVIDRAQRRGYDFVVPDPARLKTKR